MPTSNTSKEKIKIKERNRSCKENLELENPDIETLKNQKNFDVNISFEKEKKQGRENLTIDKITEKFPRDNDDIHVTYNPEDNSYELKTDNQED